MTKNKYIVSIQATIAMLLGIGFVARPLTSLITHHFGHGHSMLVSPYSTNTYLVLMILGLLLIYVAFHLYKGRKIAYIVSIILTICAFSVSLLIQHRQVTLLLLQAFFIIWLLASRHLYTIKSDLVSLAFGVRKSLVVGLVGYTYTFVGLLLLGSSGFHQNFSIQEALVASFQALFTFNDLTSSTDQAELFIYSVNVISVVIFILVTGSLFRPVRFALASNKGDKDRALKILKATSKSSEDYFKLWPDDKHYFFSVTRDSFLAYKTSGRTAIILGDPCGNHKEFTELITNFYEFVSTNGWAIAIINTTDISEAAYDRKGLNKLFIGNEAIITIADYTAYTSRSKHFRYVNNKAERDGLSVEYWQELDDDKVQKLKHVSDSWLKRGGRKEYTFFMGYFDNAYLKACSVMALKKDDNVVGYINVVPSFTKHEASIDQFRALPKTSPAAMHFLLSKLIDLLSSQGKTFLNIGFSPLSGIESREGKQLAAEKLLKLLKKFGNRYYSFKGVEQFKGKFQPVWHPRHLYYSGATTSLPYIVSDIERASRLFSEKTRKQKVIGSIVLFLIVAAISQIV